MNFSFKPLLRDRWEVRTAKHESSPEGGKSMNEFKANAAVTDEELIGVLTAISVVSKRLAGKLIRLSRSSQSMEGGGKCNGQNERNVRRHQETARYRSFY